MFRSKYNSWLIYFAHSFIYLLVSRLGGKGWRGGGGGCKTVWGDWLSLTDVKEWLDRQEPFVLQSVLKHARELLISKHKVPVEDMSDWYGEEDTDKNPVITKSGQSNVICR